MSNTAPAIHGSFLVFFVTGAFNSWGDVAQRLAAHVGSASPMHPARRETSPFRLAILETGTLSVKRYWRYRSAIPNQVRAETANYQATFPTLAGASRFSANPGSYREQMRVDGGPLPRQIAEVGFMHQPAPSPA
jgi:hypothetical protein